MAAGNEQEQVEQSHQFDGNVPSYLTEAMHDIGIQEAITKGGRQISNPAVEKFPLKVVGKRINMMTNPWCAYWVGAKLEDAGIPSTKSGMARSYLRWGVEVDPEDAQPGDIIVYWRGRCDDGVTGHVNFFLEWSDDDTVKAIGGNQGDEVSIAYFKRSKILGIRRPRGIAQSKTARAALGSGATQALGLIAEQALPQASQLDKAADLLTKVQDPLSMLAEFKPQIKIVLSLIAMALALYAVYYRIQDHKDGKNS